MSYKVIFEGADQGETKQTKAEANSCFPPAHLPFPYFTASILSSSAEFLPHHYRDHFTFKGTKK